MAAAPGARDLHRADRRVRAGGRGVRRPRGVRRAGPSHPDDRYGGPLRHVGAAAQDRGPIAPRLLLERLRGGAPGGPRSADERVRADAAAAVAAGHPGGRQRRRRDRVQRAVSRGPAARRHRAICEHAVQPGAAGPGPVRGQRLRGRADQRRVRRLQRGRDEADRHHRAQPVLQEVTGDRPQQPGGARRLPLRPQVLLGPGRPPLHPDRPGDGRARPVQHVPVLPARSRADRGQPDRRPDRDVEPVLHGHQ